VSARIDGKGFKNNDPQLIIQYRPLPTAHDGDIDWDAVSVDYHRHILGPFAPTMVQPGTDGNVRNTLVADLDSGRFGSLQGAKAADFGCGPGNLLRHLPKDIGYVLGVDKSERALALAAAAAEKSGLPFASCQANLANLHIDTTFDIIFCVNAILPTSRGQVVDILQGIRRHLRPGGKLVAILPSYDTTIYLRELWRSHYAARVNDDHADRIIRAFTDAKKADDKTSSYADDGRTCQCYHTPATIEEEFTQAGLQVERQEKVRYPWSLVKRFDYGSFPEASEEIWDWYVVASPATPVGR